MKLTIIVAALTVPNIAFATPEWSKAFGLPCSSCHAGGGNRPTSFGKEFMLRGHRLKDAAAKLTQTFNLIAKAQLTFADGAKPNGALTEVAVVGGGQLSGALHAFANLAFTDFDRSVLSGYVGLTGPLSTEHFLFARVGNSAPLVLDTNGYGAARTGISLPLPFVRPTGNAVEFVPSENRALAAFGASLGSWTFETGLKENAEMTDTFEWFASAEKVVDEEGSSVGVYLHDGDGFTRTGLLASLNRSNYSICGSLFTGQDDFLSAAMGAWHLQGEYYLGDVMTIYLRGEGFFSESSAAARAGGLVAGFSYRLPRGRVAIEGAEMRTYAATSRSLRARFVWAF